MSVDGLKEITARLQRLERDGADRAMTAGARAAAREIEKGIKDAIPGRYRSARKAIGRRVRRKKGEITAKVGAGVGKRQLQNASKRPGSTSNGGVGLSKNNIHWAILGVKKRQTKTGKNRGRHDGFLSGVVQMGVSTSEIRAALAMRQAVEKELEKSIR